MIQNKWIRNGVLAALTFSTFHCQIFFVEEPGTAPDEIFEYLWQDYHDHYGPTQIRGVDWSALYDVYRPQINANSSDQQLFDVITTMLATLNDDHVSVVAPDREHFSSNIYFNTHFEHELFDRKLIENNYLDSGYVSDTENSEYTLGTIQGDILYFHPVWVNSSFFELKPFIESKPNAKALIFDLRHNYGGDFTFMTTELGYLFDQKRRIFSSRTKNGTGANDFTKWYHYYMEPEGDYFNHPIYVLIDKYTNSAAERTVLALDVLPNVTLVGETTNGSHSTSIGRELANGWYYTISTQEILRGDTGISEEGDGISPDHAVQNTVAEMDAGKDNVIDFTLNLINSL